jgi:hypothetical protein
MAVLLILASPPRTLRAIGGGSAAGPSHSRYFTATQNSIAFGAKRISTVGRDPQHQSRMTRLGPRLSRFIALQTTLNPAPLVASPFILGIAASTA